MSTVPMTAFKAACMAGPVSILALSGAAYASDEGYIPPLTDYGDSGFITDTFRTMRKGFAQIEFADFAGNSEPIKYEKGGGGISEQLQALKKSKKGVEGTVKVKINVPPGKLGVRLREKIGGGVIIASVEDESAKMAAIPLKSHLNYVDKTNVATLGLQEVQTVIGDRFLMTRELEVVCKASELPQSHRCYLDFAGNDVGKIPATDLQAELATLRTYETSIISGAITSVGGRHVDKIISCIADRKREVKNAMRQ
jgi:hypothetical protein